MKLIQVEDNTELFSATNLDQEAPSSLWGSFLWSLRSHHIQEHKAGTLSGSEHLTCGPAATLPAEEDQVCPSGNSTTTENPGHVPEGDLGVPTIPGLLLLPVPN